MSMRGTPSKVVTKITYEPHLSLESQSDNFHSNSTTASMYQLGVGKGKPNNRVYISLVLNPVLKLKE